MFDSDLPLSCFPHWKKGDRDPLVILSLECGENGANHPTTCLPVAWSDCQTLTRQASPPRLPSASARHRQLSQPRLHHGRRCNSGLFGVDFSVVRLVTATRFVWPGSMRPCWQYGMVIMTHVRLLHLTRMPRSRVRQYLTHRLLERSGIPITTKCLTRWTFLAGWRRHFESSLTSSR